MSVPESRHVPSISYVISELCARMREARGRAEESPNDTNRPSHPGLGNISILYRYCDMRVDIVLDLWSFPGFKDELLCFLGFPCPIFCYIVIVCMLKVCRVTIQQSCFF